MILQYILLCNTKKSWLTTINPSCHTSYHSHPPSSHSRRQGQGLDFQIVHSWYFDRQPRPQLRCSRCRFRSRCFFPPWRLGLELAWKMKWQVMRLCNFNNNTFCSKLLWSKPREPRSPDHWPQFLNFVWCFTPTTCHATAVKVIPAIVIRQMCLLQGFSVILSVSASWQ